MSEDRKSNMKEAMSIIKKDFGNEALVKMDDSFLAKVKIIPTGAILLDLALGVMGVPKGRIVEIFGPEQTGKSTLALKIIAECQKQGGIAAYIDAEHSFSPDWAQKMGVNIKELYINQPDCGETALGIADRLVTNKATDVIVIDSVSALVPKAELEGEMGDAQMGLQARLMSQAMRKLTGSTASSETCVIFINQLRMKIGIVYGCFHYDTIVNFTDGRSLPIGTIVDDKINGKVWSYNIEKQRFEDKEIINWHNNGKLDIDNDFIHIQTESIDGGGRFGLTCTKDHKIAKLSISTNEPSIVWVKAKDLKITDKLISKYYKTITGEYEKFMNGIFIGDSHISVRHKNTACLKLQDNQNLEYVQWKVSCIEKFMSMHEIEIERGYQYKSDYSYELSKIKRELEDRNPIYMLKDKFSTLSLAIWIMDDACFSTEDDTRQGRYILSVKRLRHKPEGLKECVGFLNKYGYECSYIKTNNDTILFTVKGSKKIAKDISPFVPQCMSYKLPEKYRSSCTDEILNLTRDNIIPVIDYVNIKELRPASDKQMRNTRKFDISIKDNKNYMVGGKHNGIIVHNSPEVTSGGNALKFYSSVRMDVRRGEPIKEGEELIGHMVRVKVIKNKVATPHKKALIPFYYSTGYDNNLMMLDLAVKYDIVNKAGAWYSYKEEKIGQGKINAAEYIAKNKKIQTEIEKTVYKILGISKEEKKDEKQQSTKS